MSNSTFLCHYRLVKQYRRSAKRSQLNGYENVVRFSISLARLTSLSLIYHNKMLLLLKKGSETKSDLRRA